MTINELISLCLNPFIFNLIAKVSSGESLSVKVVASLKRQKRQSGLWQHLKFNLKLSYVHVYSPSFHITHKRVIVEA